MGGERGFRLVFLEAVAEVVGGHGDFPGLAGRFGLRGFGIVKLARLCSGGFGHRLFGLFRDSRFLDSGALVRGRQALRHGQVDVGACIHVEHEAEVVVHRLGIAVQAGGGLFLFVGGFDGGGSHRGGLRLGDDGTDAAQLGGDAVLDPGPGGRGGGGLNRCGCNGLRCGRFGHDGPGGGGRNRGGFFRGQALGAQHDAVLADSGLDPAVDLALGDAVQHLGVRGGRFCAEVTVFGGQIAEILGDGLHGRERLVEPLERAGEGSIGNRQDLVGTDHGMLSFALSL